MSTTAPRTTGNTERPGTARWRTVDIVVASVLAVAFGVVFWAWNTLWSVTGPAFAAFPPAQGFMYGVWLMPAVLGPLVIRKPGAGLYCELLATVVSVLFGAPWGLQLVLYGVIEGAAGELGFALFRWRAWGLPVALLAGALAGLAAFLLDAYYYYAGTWSAGFLSAYAALVIPSCVVIAGLGSWALTRALARTGVLDPFPSGRTGRLV